VIVQPNEAPRQGVRVRPDLIYAHRDEGGEEQWIVKDPVTLRYFHFGPHEVFIMRLVDGRNTLAEIKAEYEKRFAPCRISKPEIAGFCHGLHRRGLLIGAAENQGETLLKRASQNRWMQIASLSMQVLSIRLPGVDPERFLTATRPAVDWLFHRVTVGFVLATAVLVTILGLLNLESILEMLPAQEQFFRGENLLLLTLTLIVTKIFHELGHAYCCKAFGGECHQIGVLIMVFAPAMYCDVSDAWLFRSRWHRMFVSAAGMYVELIIAMVAAVLWYFAQPGPLQMWLLNVVFVCGVSTLVINANPLLRYDGYYILSDWLNLPNLSSRATAALWGPVKDWFFNRDTPLHAVEERRWTLRVYAALAIVYRVFVFAMIFWFFHQALEQNDLLPLWHILVALFAGGLLLRPAMSWFHWFSRPKRRGESMSKMRLAFALLVAIGIAALLAGIPIPSRVHAPVIAEMDADRRVYVQVAGRLKTALQPGTRVDAGDIVAQLENHDLVAEEFENRASLELQQQHLESLRLRRNNSPEAAAQIPTAESALVDLQQRQELIEQQISQLSIKAPASGAIVSAPRKMKPKRSEKRLSTWDGDPLAEENRGCWLLPGELLCYVGEDQTLEARLFVSQDEIELLRSGDTVQMLFDGASTISTVGQVTEISTDQNAEIPRNLRTIESLGIVQDADGSLRIPSGAYSATVRFENLPVKTLLPGTVGRAVVIGRSQTIWEIAVRFVRLNFDFGA